MFVALLSLSGLMSLSNVSRGVYIVLFALLSGVVALWLGVTALARGRRARTARPRGALVATIIASVGILLSSLLLLTFAVLGTQLAQYGRCYSGANTITAKHTCYSRLVHEIAVLRSSTRNG